MTQALSRPARVAVVGGGFCGAFFAAQLAHYATGPISIRIVEPRALLGGGVAYSSADPAHRINVPAGRMSLFADNPTDFDQWFRAGAELPADPEALWPDGLAYPRRAAFGRYMAELVARRAAARPDVTIEHVKDRAIAVQRTAAGYEIELAEGGRLAADIVVLAISHPPPGVPAPIVAGLGDDPAVIADPWRDGALAAISPEDDVLIIGTGLTMADMVASLHHAGHQGRIGAVSRRGLLPRGHASIPVATPYAWFADHQAPTSLPALTALVRALIRAAAAENLPWQAVFDDVRANGQTLWRRLNTAERRRFLRHLRVYWDAHRYRIAPQIESMLREKQNNGSLRVLAARLVSAQRQNDKIHVTVRPRRAGGTEIIAAHHLIITTGPAHASAVRHNPALQSLATQGLLQPDELGLGVKVTQSGQALDTTNQPTPNLFVVGPLAREQYGELMGLPQVATQPNDVAAHVASRMAEWVGAGPASK